MAQLPHLLLRRLEGELLPRRKHGGGKPTMRDPGEHGPRIQAELEGIVETQKARPRIAEINPALILKIQTTNPIDEADWARVGLTVLATEPNKALVMFATDSELSDFRRRVEAYQREPPKRNKHPEYASFVNAIEDVSEISPNDRIGPALKAQGFQDITGFHDSERLVVDVEIWRPGDDEVRGYLVRVAARTAELGGSVINEYRGNAATLVRIQGGGTVIRALLELPEIALIDLPPSPDLPPIEFTEITIQDVGQIVPPLPDAAVIGIIDSGISAGHPLLAAAVVGSFGFPDTLGDNDQKGHGTPVAGIAVYGDVGQHVQSRLFNSRFRLASAKVVNEDGLFDDGELVPRQMEYAIRSLHDDYNCQVINISLADIRHPVGAKPSAWAATLDDLARELDLVIVVTTGNTPRVLVDEFGDGIVDSYPDFLFDQPNRLLEPASAINAITVGSIAHSNGIGEQDGELVGIRPITQRNQPSPFTRVGPGIGRMMKPDFVDYGGTAIFDGPTQTVLDGGRRPPAGILSLHHRYLDQLFTSRSGTSFARALLAYKAAFIREAFPAASANLVRCLLAIGAEVPDAARACLSEREDESQSNLLGLGIVDIERSLASNEGRVVLYREDRLPVDRFAVYEVPITEAFQITRGQRQIKIALAFDPPVRHTRLDYAGITMNFSLIRGTLAEDVLRHFRKWQKSEGPAFRIPDRFKCPMVPRPKRRERGTLQCATFTAERNIESYGDRYYLVVQCEGGWAAELLREQRFAVAVELQHEADIQLYERVRVRVRV
jgi:Subtilase family